MKITSGVLLGFIIASASPVCASTIEVVVHGTNVGGYDYNGVFGAPSASIPIGGTIEVDYVLDSPTGSLATNASYPMTQYTVTYGSFVQTFTDTAIVKTFTTGGCGFFGCSPVLQGLSITNAGWFTNAVGPYVYTDIYSTTPFDAVLSPGFTYANGNSGTTSQFFVVDSGFFACNPFGGCGTHQHDAFQLGYNATSFSISAIPEPSTWAMMIVGFVGIGAIRRRNQSTALNAA